MTNLLFCLDFSGTFLTKDNCTYHMFDISSSSEEGESGSMGVVDMPR